MSEIAKQIKIVADALEAGLTKEALNSRYFGTAKKFAAKHADVLLKEGVEASLVSAPALSKTPTKPQLALICALPFGSRKIYETFLEFLPEDVRKVWHELVWEERLNDTEIEKRTGIAIYIKKNVSTYYSRTVQIKELKSQFQILYDQRLNYYFGYYEENQDITLGLPPALRLVLASYYDQPEEAKLTPVAQLQPTAHTYLTGERDILLEWPRILSYKEQGQIAYTGKDRPVHTTLPKMNRSLSLQEFFPGAEDKKLKTLRTFLLAGLAIHVRGSKSPTETPDLIRNLFRKAYPESIYSAPLVLPDLKGMGYIDNYDLHKKEHEILRVLASLPAGEWVPFENIRNFVRYCLLDIRPLSDYSAQNKLYYEYEGEAHWDNKHSIKKGEFGSAVEIPFLRGSFFLFAAFGICDIAYDNPDLDQIGRSCYSSWDGLRYVRRTKLGDYVCGFSKTYDASGISADTSITLSPDTLLLLTEESDTSAAAILEPYTERLGANRFRTDNQIFLKNIKSKKELEGKIALFKQIIGSELPPNWEAFFQDMLHKVNPFEPLDEAKVLLIPSENKALIQLVAQDPVLKTLVVKAEGFRIIVPKGNYAAMKRRLQEFGYLLT